MTVDRYCLDTSAIIWFLRGKRETIHLVDQLRREGIPACSALSAYEVEVGMRGGEEEKTRKFLNAFHVYPVEIQIARLAAEYGRRYGRKERKLTIIDALIAATCIVHNLVLVTYDLTGFPMPELHVYPIPGVQKR